MREALFLNARWAMIALACGCGASDAPPTDPALCTADAPCWPATTFPDIEVSPGQEISDLCQSWTLNNPEELWVTGVEMDNGGVYHHSNWFFVPDDAYAVLDGAWPCVDNDFSELEAAVLGGFLFAQSTQSTHEEQRFARGAAVRIPPYSRIIGSTHLLNASDRAVTTSMTLRVESAPVSEVAVKLVPGRIEYRDLKIPANATAEFTTECDLATAYSDVMGEPLRFGLYYVLPHYHELGSYFQLEVAGGERDGEVLFRHDGYGGETFGQAFDPPVDLAAMGATGIRFTCGYTNPRAEEVRWGIGDQEMCVLATFADTGMGFEGDVSEGTGGVTGTGSDGTVLNQGPCRMLGLPWSHDKPGGPPR